MENNIEKIIESFKESHPMIDPGKFENKSISNEDKFIWPYNECPYFIDTEINQLRDYYAESGNESYHDYFDEGYAALKRSEYPPKKSWGSRINELQNKANMSEDPEEIDQIKQNILDLGWNPEIPYSAETQTMAKERYENLMTEQMHKFNIIDISYLFNNISNYDLNTITEAKKEKLYPVSIVLVRGDSPIAPVIAKFTGSDYTHSAIALDGDFTKLYSFNFFNDIKLGGGLSLESVKRYPAKGKLAIYTFFVNKVDYDALQDKLQGMMLNIKNTTYSMVGLLFYPFKYINFNNSEKMICSQFVDSCMKLINIDITNKSSSKVSPAMLDKVAVSNAKIYKTYQGLVEDFNLDKVKMQLNKLSTSARPIKESGIFIEPIIVEARKFPVEIKNNGDVLLSNPFPNFDSEYMASHKLLVQYDKAGNIEPMKYELARLYYMNYILERKLYHNHFIKNKEKNMKTRARVLNDFNKYIKVVLKHQPEFNFAEYYEQSPFYANTIEIKGSTINKIKNIFDYIL